MSKINDHATVDQLEEPANHLVIATDMLQEMVCNLGSNSGETIDVEAFDRTFYLACAVKRDAAALRELLEKVVGADLQRAAT
jgi:hypothetical protein